jgi:hypothetical protein
VIRKRQSEEEEEEEAIKSGLLFLEKQGCHLANGGFSKKCN